jgi:hypothetical protein
MHAYLINFAGNLDITGRVRRTRNKSMDSQRKVWLNEDVRYVKGKV